MKTLYSKPYFPLFNQSSYFFVDWFKIIVSSRERLFYCFFFLTFGIHCDGIKLIILPSSVNHRFSCALSWQNQIWITFFGWKTNLTISSKMLFIRRDFVGQTIYRAQHCFPVQKGFLSFLSLINTQKCYISQQKNHQKKKENHFSFICLFSNKKFFRDETNSLSQR